MTGKELAAIRKAARLSQTELARRAGIGRHAVSYWECKAVLDLRGWAVQRMARALGVSLPDYWQPNARARTWAVSVIEAFPARPKADARRRVPCGAKTRKGTACLNKSEPGKRRCKFHGGKSTGARTPEGRERIAEAQRRRWAKWRENHPI